MNNNIKKESLDLEAMMNHLDQKAEKKKEFNSELESLNEMLNMLGVELLTVKDGLQQIENGKHELATMNENMNDWIAKSELFVEAMREIASGIVDSKPEVIIGESAKHDLKVIFNSHVNFMAALLNGFTDSQDKEHTEFKEELKKVFEESEETERKRLSKFHYDLDETLSNAGIWFSARIFYLMLGLFLPCFAFTVFMLAWFIAR